MCDESTPSPQNRKQRIAVIYLDTNVLLPSWPYSIPAATQQILYLAKVLRTVVYLPSPVEIELEAHWQREWKQIINNASSLKENLTRLDPGWNCDPVPDSVSLLNQYRSLAGSLKKTLALWTSPFPQKSLADFFNLAAQHEFPFEPEGKNFQDAVILYSVLEHNSSLGSPRAAFLSRNKRDYVFSSFARLSSLLHAGVEYFSSEAKLEEHLIEGMRDIVRELWTKNQDDAKSAIEQASDDLTMFLAGRFVKSDQVGVRLKGVREVRTFLLDVRNTNVPFSLLADVDFVVSFPGLAPTVNERTVTVTGEGELRDGHFVKISFQSAELI